MKLLLLDDTLEYWKPAVRALKMAGHEVVGTKDVGIAWSLLQRGDRFDLVIIDLLLDRASPEFAQENKEITQGLASKGVGAISASGQVVGLRLWRQRQQLKQPYCYITNNSPALWVSNIDQNDPEFAHTSQQTPEHLVIDKSTIWPANVEAILKESCVFWAKQSWLNP